MINIKENLKSILERIEKSALRSGRKPEDIKLVAVTKTVPIDKIKFAIDCGVKIIGENRIQEAEDKYDEMNKDGYTPQAKGFEWHLIGHLQTNKVKKALEMFTLIHSVDTFHLANEINKRAEQTNKVVDILIEVNTTEEETKYGVSPHNAVQLIRQIAKLKNVKIRGLMTVGAFLSDPELVRPFFVTLRHLKEEIESYNIENVSMDYLSMGMTNDFETAIEEGANIVRIGTGIFGSR